MWTGSTDIALDGSHRSFPAGCWRGGRVRGETAQQDRSCRWVPRILQHDAGVKLVRGWRGERRLLGDGFAGRRDDAGEENGYMDYAAMMRLSRSGGCPDEFIGRKDVAP